MRARSIVCTGIYEANNHSVKFRAEEQRARNRLCVFRAEEHTDRFDCPNAEKMPATYECYLFLVPRLSPGQSPSVPCPLDAALKFNNNVRYQYRE